MLYAYNDNVNSFPSIVLKKKKVTSTCQHFWSFFTKKCHDPQNILLYEYLNMQYIKRNNRASAFKQQ